jgi:hypothetical protein
MSNYARDLINYLFISDRLTLKAVISIYDKNRTNIQ